MWPQNSQKPYFLAFLAIFEGHFPERPNSGDLFDNGFGTLGPLGKIPCSHFLGYISFLNQCRSDRCGEGEGTHGRNVCIC